MSNRMKKLYNQVIFERRILLTCTLFIGLSLFLWAISTSTDHWISTKANQDTGLVLNVHDANKLFLKGHMGLFRYCIKGVIRKPKNYTDTLIPFRECHHKEMFPMDQKLRRERGFDVTLINYARTQVSFAVFSMFIMIMGFGFSIYTFRNPRYMFKRLAGGIHFITCACIMAVIQVLLSAVDYGSKKDVWIFPKGVEISYDFSLILAWFVFLNNFFSGCAFMLFSRKRKRDKAPNDELAMADAPTIIGR